MSVGGDEVHDNRTKFFADATEFLIGVNITDVEAADCVKVDGSHDFLENGRVRAIADGTDSAKTDPTGDGMKETNPLHEEEIDAEGDVSMVFRDWGRKRNGLERRCPRGGSGARHFSFQCCDIGSVDLESTTGVIRRDRAIPKEIFGKD